MNCVCCMFIVTFFYLFLHMVLLNRDNFKQLYLENPPPPNRWDSNNITSLGQWPGSNGNYGVLHTPWNYCPTAGCSLMSYTGYSFWVSGFPLCIVYHQQILNSADWVMSTLTFSMSFMLVTHTHTHTHLSITLHQLYCYLYLKGCLCITLRMCFQ